MKFLATETRQTSPFNIVQAFAPKAKPVATHICLPKTTAQEPISAFVLSGTKQPRLQGVVTPFTTAPLARYSQSCSWRSSSPTNVQRINVPNINSLLEMQTQTLQQLYTCNHWVMYKVIVLTYPLHAIQPTKTSQEKSLCVLDSDWLVDEETCLPEPPCQQVLNLQAP